jgi:hypothetical protein
LIAPLLAVVLAVTGLHGVVRRGPTTPVCRAGTPCTAPAPGAVLVFERSGHPAVRVRAGAGGRYHVRLPAGVYAVTVSQQSSVGSGILPHLVRVTVGVWRRLDFMIDTGIR